MNTKLVTGMLGRLLMLAAVFLMVPLAVSLGYREKIAHAYLLPALGSLALGLLAVRFGRGARRGLYAREGFIITGAAWILLAVVGAFPFWIEGSITSFIDCLFESVSGFTTTGATILITVEALPHSLLLWRSFSHFVGGMGVLTLFLAILPAMGERSIQLLRAESPGPSPSKFSPKIGGTARFLYISYTGLTLVQTIILRIVGMPWFDAVNHAMTTASTGGFSVKTDSIAFYHSPAINLVLTLFMLLFGMNFTVFFLMFARRFREAFQFSETRFYIGLYAGVVLMMTLVIQDSVSSFGEALDLALFQTASAMTTTGLVAGHYGLWPMAAQVLLCLVMFVGACSSSTSGGLKLSRLMILLKSSARECRRILHPRSVNLVRMDGAAVPENTIYLVTIFFFCYAGVLIAGSVIVALDNTSFATAFSATLACLSNTGAGLGDIGPGGSYAFFSVLSKITLSLAMLMGRLELFPILVLMMPSAWKK